MHAAGGTAFCTSGLLRARAQRRGVCSQTGRTVTAGRTRQVCVRMAAAGGADRALLGADPVFAQTMLRVKDAEKTRHFYEKLLGMRYLTHLDFPSLDFSLHFLAYVDDEQTPADGVSQEERAQWLWSRRYPTMEFTHNYGTEKDPNFAHHNGNTSPLGFRHVQVLVNNVQGAVDALKKEGVTTVQEPELLGDQIMVATVADPDGYWVSLAQKRTPTDGPAAGVIGADPVLGTTTLRVKNAEKSIKFYEELGLKMVAQVENADAKYTGYYMSLPAEAQYPGQDADKKKQVEYVQSARSLSLELNHSWGAEKDESVQYHNGNSDPQGYGHIGFIVSDVYKVADSAEKNEITIKRKASPFQNAGVIAFIADPDGYLIELITRNGEPQGTPYAKPSARA
mmetsp:Transcript_7485/g.22723  ORF Transcript_7485/g.22723 Transcript_7485/m.22723 type:complete len:395 (+) Transcript_7485:66-1250(+)